MRLTWVVQQKRSPGEVFETGYFAANDLIRCERAALFFVYCEPVTFATGRVVTEAALEHCRYFPHLDLVAIDFYGWIAGIACDALKLLTIGNELILLLTDKRR